MVMVQVISTVLTWWSRVIIFPIAWQVVGREGSCIHLGLTIMGVGSSEVAEKPCRITYILVVFECEPNLRQNSG